MTNESNNPQEPTVSELLNEAIPRICLLLGAIGIAERRPLTKDEVQYCLLASTALIATFKEIAKPHSVPAEGLIMAIRGIKELQTDSMRAIAKRFHDELIRRSENAGKDTTQRPDLN